MCRDGCSTMRQKSGATSSERATPEGDEASGCMPLKQVRRREQQGHVNQVKAE
jgi:hypothetical protein